MLYILILSILSKVDKLFYSKHVLKSNFLGRRPITNSKFLTCLHSIDIQEPVLKGVKRQFSKHNGNHIKVNISF